ncbi:MAG: hypothetical protein EXS09_18415 [Gemmataceae bacterium]|nr:hypothetical protein [Gemmataceae bacterium]
MTTDNEPFQRGVIRPMECIKAGWALIKEKYWLFFGISVLGMLIASFGPFGVLMGPMMCGIYYCLFRQMRGQPVKFEMLFKGFEYFIPSLIATLLMMIPMIIVMIPGYIILFVLLMASMPQPKPDGPPPALSDLVPFLVYSGLFILVLMVVQLVVTVLFFFTFPLIIDRKMKGIDALKLSYRAAKANLGGVIGLVLLGMVFSMVGALACYVGAFFVMPIHFAASAMAYRHVFPELDEPETRDEPGADLQA